MTAVSVCIIGKNEEAHLERLFKSIDKAFTGYPHEVLFVDTGSSDDTKEVAAKYADRVIDFKWVNDFSAARISSKLISTKSQCSVSQKLHFRLHPLRRMKIIGTPLLTPSP